MKVNLVTNLPLLWLLVVCGEASLGNPLDVFQSPDGWMMSLMGPGGALNLILGRGPSLHRMECPETPRLDYCLHDVLSEPKVTIKTVDTGFSTVSCHEIDWTNSDSTQEDCILLGDDHWYGGSEMKVQRWPIKDVNLTRVPFVTGDYLTGPLGGIIEGLWFNSIGHFVFVDRETPLFIRFNDTGNNKLCLSSSYDEYPYNGVTAAVRSSKHLKYNLCSAANIREAFQVAYSRWMRKPSDRVEASVVTRPIWSTWARYKAEINETTLIDFAKQIKDHGFSGSHIEIDDKWERCYGDLEFDETKFPDAKDMVKRIKGMGFNVSLWIHPYINIECSIYSDPKVKDLFIKNAASEDPLECTWFNGVGGYIDTTNEDAVTYYINRLKRIRNIYGIDTFKFDSGEVTYIANNYMLADSDIMATPNEFTTRYVETAAMLGTGVEVRVAYHSQHLPIFVRMLDKDSRWDYQNGLQTLIPTALHMSVIGYPYILPDMIGGNNYGSSSPDQYPARELFIRWLQVNVFMPALQFSIVPWDYDAEVVTISKAMVELHEQYAPLINQLAKEASETGNPIVRPLWWIAPNDEEALAAEQQYLLGDYILVAPVVEMGATGRDIYLPAGKWEDQITPGTIYFGPTLLKDYPAALDQLPYFIRKE